MNFDLDKEFQDDEKAWDKLKELIVAKLKDNRNVPSMTNFM